MTQTVEFYHYHDTRVFTLVENNSKTVNLPMNDRIIKIYKGADSFLSFRIKNQDRKPVSMSGKNATAYFKKNGAAVASLSRPLLVTGTFDGECELLIHEKDIRNLQTGLYHLTITLTDSNGVTRTLYSDYNQRAAATVEIVDDQLPNLSESIELTQFYDLQNNDVYYSDIYSGDAQSFDKAGLHTFAIYATNFSGKVYAEGTLDLQGTNNSRWFELSLSLANKYILLTNFSGVDAYNFTGNLMWVRFRYEPDQNNTGTLDKIVYRS